MKLRRYWPLAERLQSAALRMERCQACIALIDRVRPLNLTSELGRLLRAFEAGERPRPEFGYARPPDLTEVRRELHQLAHSLSLEQQAEAGLLAERALELELEAALAESVGGSGFAELSRRRFPLPENADLPRQVAKLWLSAAPAYSALGDRSFEHVSDDRRDPESLWSQLSAYLSRENLPVRVEIVPGLVSLAAVADGVVRVRAGARLTASAARRIVLHEVDGHLRPRLAGRLLGGAFLAGTALGSEDEEGRAVLLEERAGLLDRQRRRELAFRYLAAESLHAGAGFWETVELLGRAGALASAAIELACRVHRGGGLGRELVYLTAYHRVASGLALRPELERLLASGRVSLAAAEALLFGSVELDDDGNVV